MDRNNVNGQKTMGSSYLEMDAKNVPTKRLNKDIKLLYENVILHSSFKSPISLGRNREKKQ